MQTTSRSTSAGPSRQLAPRSAAHVAAALALLLAPGALVPTLTAPLGAQQPAAAGRVSGQVTNEAGQPIANVQVTLTGTRFGALTGADGRYNIVNVPAGSYTVRIARIGYAPRTQTVSVGTAPVGLDFRLSPTATELTAVVSVGYTQEARRDISGAVASVSGNEIRDQKVATVEEALRGRAPGVQISASGQPGRPAQIIVRGQNGFNNPSPLYVVDGMYVGQQNPNLNPDDIASIQVLKDASAAAQYGFNASNGVIVITTRRGSSGPNRFSVESYYGIQQVPRTIPMASTAEFQRVFQQAYANAGQTAPAGVTGQSAVSTDWQSALFQSGAIQNHNLTASGGTATANYLVTGSVLDQAGTVMNTGFRRYSARVNSELRRGRFTIGEALALSQARQQDYPNGIFGGQALPLIDIVALPPTIPVRDAANPGGYGFGSDANPTFALNPIAALEQNYNRRRSNQVLGTAYGEVRLVGNLRYRLNLGINYADSLARVWTSATQLRYRTPIAPVNGLPGATLFQATPTATNLLWENLLNYDGELQDGRHRISAVVGQTSQRNEFQQQTAFRQGFANQALQEINAGSTTGFNNSGFLIPFRTNSALGRATYTFNDRYLTTVSARYDCSSRFSPDNRCGTFGAASVGWVASEERFFKSIPLLGRADFFKLRASLGVLGDQNIGDLRTAVPITQNVNYLSNGQVIAGATQTVIANTNLRWQRNRSSDIGLDLGLFGSALTITADYYSNDADQVLVDLPLPGSLGSERFPAFNAGKIRNAGFELGATHRYERDKFRLNTTFTLTTTDNRVLSLGNGGQPIFSNLDPRDRESPQIARTAEGGPVGEFFLIRTAGIFQTQADIDAHTTTVRGADNTTRVVRIQPNARPGDLRFVDANGDGTVNNDDRVRAGNPIPTVTSGLFLDARYGAFDVGFNVRGGFGNKIYNAVRLQTERVTGLNNVREGYSPWTAQNTNTSTPRAVFGDAVNGNPVTDRWLEDGDFVRIQNVVLGYTIPARYTRRLGALGERQPRIYVNAQNLYTFTSYSGFDPEILGFGDPLARGIDNGLIYPTPRTVTFGFDLRF